MNVVGRAMMGVMAGAALAALAGCVTRQAHKATVLDLERAKSDLTKAEEAKARLVAKIAAMEQLLASAKSEKGQWAEQKAFLQKEISRQGNTIATLTAERNAADLREKEQKQAAAALKKQLAVAKAARGEGDKLRMENAELKGKVATLEKTVQKLRQQVAESKAPVTQPAGRVQ